MIRHLLRLAWKKKTTNALLMIEIFVAFLVTFVVTALSVYLWDNHQQPLGFVWEDVWGIQIETGDGQAGDSQWQADQVETFRSILHEAEQLPEIEGAAGVLTLPFELGGSTRTSNAVEMQVNEVTDDFLEVMRLEMVAGRWFSVDDDGKPWTAAVIDRDLARAAFDGDPVGQSFPREPEGHEYRVVGVIAEFREDGELSPQSNYLFQRKSFDADDRLLRDLVVRVQPGTAPGFEETLVERLRAVAPGWSFEIRDLAGLRRTSRNFRLAPLLVAAVLGTFLLVMVALGLIGVLWQNVTQRTRELGLRRAVGADRRQIYQQILMELVLVTTVSLAAGVAILVQLPFLDLIGNVSRGVFLAALAGSIAILYVLTIFCGLYPSWLATRIEAADALRSE